MNAIDYTKLSLTEISASLADVAVSAQGVFGSLDEGQLNWREDSTRWSVAQCFEHLLTTNQLSLGHAQRAIAHSPEGIWQRLPILPSLFGPMIVRSQAPAATRKYRAPGAAQPSKSTIAPDIVQRFAAQQRDAADWALGLDEAVAQRKIMASPFLSMITFSVLDGLRLMVAHDHRHFQQARRVTQCATFGD
jgi:hypothetical protein